MELKLDDFLNRDNLVAQRKDGLVLFDYNKTIQFNFDWDNVSINARGIVFEEDTGKLVARPYRKFWNYEELHGEAGEKLPERYRPNFEGDFMVLEKADGSCGITYFYNGEWRVNTRGSFVSDQAIWAKNYLDANIKTDLMNPGYTYLFEIIYPENRIVVDYGNLETLCLTGIIERDTGRELWYDELQVEANKIDCMIVSMYPFSSLEEMFTARQGLSVNEEGYVITYRNGYKFKLKGEAYCAVHRAISNLSPLNFWRAIDLESFFIPNDFLEKLPEEFRDTVDKLKEVTEELHMSELRKILAYADNIPDFSDGRDGKKQRFFYIKENVPTELIGSVISAVEGKLGKVKQSIHARVRPTNNSYNGVQLDERVRRLLEES